MNGLSRTKLEGLTSLWTIPHEWMAWSAWIISIARRHTVGSEKVHRGWRLRMSERFSPSSCMTR